MRVDKDVTGRWLFFWVTIGLLILSFGYQHFYAAKLLKVASHATLHDIDWQLDKGVVMECDFANPIQSCRFDTQQRTLTRIVGKIKGSGLPDSMVVYRFNLQTKACDSASKIVLISDKDQQRQWKASHKFFQLDDSGLVAAQGRLFFEAPVEGLQFLIELDAPNCQLELKGFHLQQAQSSAANQWVKFLFLSAWLLVLVWVLKWVFQRKSRWNWPILMVIGLLIFGTQVTKSTFDPIKFWINGSEQQVSSSPSLHPYEVAQPQEIQAHLESGPSPFIVMTKIAHFVLFSFLTLLLRLKLGPQSVGWIVTYALLFALSTEVLQAFGTSRSSSIADIFIDFSGALLALLLLSRPFIYRRLKSG